jgi:hypothetical protein
VGAVEASKTRPLVKRRLRREPVGPLKTITYTLVAVL